MPTIVTADAARRQVRDLAISDEDITALITRAEATAVAFLDRNVYPDDAALTAARASAATAYQEAVDAALAEREEVLASPAGPVRDATLDRLDYDLRRALAEYTRATRGMVTNGRFEAGVLLLVGHFYANAEGVVVDTGVQALELPWGIQNVLYPDRLVGV